MRLRNAMGFAVLGALLASGCSRLTFVKPNASRGDYSDVLRLTTEAEATPGIDPGSVRSKSPELG